MKILQNFSGGRQRKPRDTEPTRKAFNEQFKNYMTKQLAAGRSTKRRSKPYTKQLECQYKTFKDEFKLSNQVPHVQAHIQATWTRRGMERDPTCR